MRIFCHLELDTIWILVLNLKNLNLEPSPMRQALIYGKYLMQMGLPQLIYPNLNLSIQPPPQAHYPLSDSKPLESIK